MIISQREYLERLKIYVESNVDKEDKKPVGMFGVWAYWSKNKKEFDKLLKEQGIIVRTKK
jgi:hypothetical protein